jgi:hypothetical protein
LPSEHCLNHCTEADVAVEPGGAPLHLLSCERLLLDEERGRLAELQAAAQQRLRDLEAGS